MTAKEGGGGPFGVVQSDAAEGVAKILHPAAYDEPEFVDISLPAGLWTRLASRDIQRAMFTVFRAIDPGELYIRSGTNPVARPFVMAGKETVFTLLYPDYLTIVTGEFFGWAVSGELITIGTVRQL